MGRRTEIQIALLIAGVIVWGYGHRTDTHWLQWTGVAFFASATALRFVRRPPKE